MRCDFTRTRRVLWLRPTDVPGPRRLYANCHPVFLLFKQPWTLSAGCVCVLRPRWISPRHTRARAHAMGGSAAAVASSFGSAAKGAATGGGCISYPS